MAEQEAQIYAKAATTAGFNLKTDFIDQLDGEYGLALSASDLTSGSPKIDAIFVTDTVNARRSPMWPRRSPSSSPLVSLATMTT